MKEPKYIAKKNTQTCTRVTDEALHQFMGYKLKLTFNVFRSGLMRVLEPLDLRMVTYSALVLIKDNPGMRQSQLADALSIERPNLVVIVDELERRELINREPSKTDRRAYSLSITQAGRQLCDKATNANKKSEERLLKNVDAETRQIMLQTMDIIRKASEGGGHETDT